MLENDLIHSFIQINKYEGIEYFNKERIEEYIRWHFLILTINEVSQSFSKGKFSKKSFSDALKHSYGKYVANI